MPRLVTLYSLQWGDLSLEEVCIKAKEFGYDGIEIGLPDHLDVRQKDPSYYQEIKGLLNKYGMELRTISSHLVGQAVCDQIDERHKSILPDYIWGDGDPEGVRTRAAEELILTAKAAKELGVDTVVGFTGSPVWHLLYSLPPFPQSVIDDGYKEFARRFTPILNEYHKLGVRFALEVHPTEIAFDTFSARKALEALEYHPAFGFNYDPSHLGYQGVDYVDFIYQFPDRIFHVHMKDAIRKLINEIDRKSTRLNSSHVRISYAVFCLKKKNKYIIPRSLSTYWSSCRDMVYATLGSGK